MEEKRGSELRSLTYILVPRELAAKLHEPLRKHFGDDRAVSVVVDRRSGSERRESAERRAAERGVASGAGEPSAAPEGDERRRIRSEDGLRVAERRALAVPVTGPPLPRPARRYAQRLGFVERLEPSAEQQLDLEAARLVLSHQAGDSAAYAELYLRYFDRVYGYARIALRDHHEAEDTAQQVFTKAVAALSRYEVRSGEPFRVWLFTIARNTIITAARKRNSQVPEAPEVIDRRRDAAVEDPTFDALSWLSDKDISFFVERLTPDQRQVLVLRYLLDLPSAEVAAVMKRKPNAIYNLERRALDTLRERLASVGRTGRVRQVPTRVRIRRQTVLRGRRFALSGNFTPASRLLAATRGARY